MLTVAFTNVSVAIVAAIVAVVAVVAVIGDCPEVVHTETSLKFGIVWLDNTHDTFPGAHRASIAFNLDVID